MTSPSPGTDRDRPKRADFRLPWDIVVAPARAFERIAASPEWLLAYVVITALMLAAVTLEYPALLHVETSVARAAHQETFDSSNFFANVLVANAVQPLIVVMLQAIAVTVFAATRNGKNFAKYSTFVSLAANCAVIDALGEFVQAVAIHTRHPASFENLRSLDTVLPIKMTYFADPGNINQAIFLSHFGVFDIWSSIVFSYGLARLAKIALLPSLVFVFTLDLVLAFFL